VFRRQISQPVSVTVEAGTPVISSSGREVGTVSSLVVELPSGRASYAVAPEAAGGRVLLLPRDALRRTEDSAVVEERVLHRLARKSA
jgi:sporulation protein YlmC with PRC-barrel domain